jgi:hypothetical protein
MDHEIDSTLQRWLKRPVQIGEKVVAPATSVDPGSKGQVNAKMCISK